MNLPHQSIPGFPAAFLQSVSQEEPSGSKSLEQNTTEFSIKPLYLLNCLPASPVLILTISNWLQTKGKKKRSLRGFQREVSPLTLGATELVDGSCCPGIPVNQFAFCRAAKL